MLNDDGHRLHLIVHPDSASLATLFMATGHTKDEFGNPFEIEDILFESRTYEPGDTVTYEIGDTD